MELSLIELESELSAALPTRTLMSRRHGRRMGSASAHANNGSVANANGTTQSIMNAQTAVVTGINTGAAFGQGNGALVAQIGANQNNNNNLQFGTPVNFQG